MNGKPTAAQKRFHQWCREFGCIITFRSNPAIHHIKGSKMNLKGCNNPGEWYVIPLSYWWHQDGLNNAAIHINKTLFQFETEGTEKNHWIKLIQHYEDEHNKKPMSEEEYKIIVDRA